MHTHALEAVGARVPGNVVAFVAQSNFIFALVEGIPNLYNFSFGFNSRKILCHLLSPPALLPLPWLVSPVACS